MSTALLFFNVGVEIGQILFVLALLAGFYLLRPAFVRLLRSARDNEVHWSSLTTPASPSAQQVDSSKAIFSRGQGH